MPRSVRDSDDDCEPATSRMQTRLLAVQCMSPSLRRSSRIKQNKCSPGSESDNSSTSNSQTTRNTRTRTASMSSTVSDTMKKPRTRKLFISDTEIDIDTPQTPGKQVTKQNLGSNIGTPTRVNTRSASKRFMRAVSETQSPLSVAKTTRKTRANSIGPESSFDQNKNQSDSPIKTRRRVSMLPSSSLIKEHIELEDRIPYVRLAATIIETDEITSAENLDSSPDKALHLLQNIQKQSTDTDKDKVEDDSCEKIEISTDSSKDEIFQLLKKNDETQAEDIDRETMKNIEDTFAEGQLEFEKAPPSNSATIDQASTSSSSKFLPDHQNSAKKDKIKIVKESCLSNIEESLINLCDSTKILENVPENLLDTEEQKNNKEIEIQNINSDDTSIEESMHPNVTSSCIKSLSSSFMNKSSSLFITEKETEPMKKELRKRSYLRESTEIAIKHNLSKEVDLQEKMDISMESLNSIATNETVLSRHDSIELVDKITNKNETSIEIINICNNKDTMEVISESDKIDKKECAIIDNKNSNKIESDKVDKTSRSSVSPAKSTQIENIDGNRESFTSILTIGDNSDDNSDEIKLTLEERSLCQDENEVSLNVIYSEPDQSEDLQILSPINESSEVRTTVIQNEVIDSSDSIEEKQENLSKLVIEPTPKSSNTTLEINNVTHVDLNNGLIQKDGSDIIETPKKSAMDISPEKTAAKEIVRWNFKQKNTNENLQMETSQKKDQENVEIDDIEIDDVPNVKFDSVQFISQSVEEVENDNKDNVLISIDKQSWLVGKMIKTAKEMMEDDSFEDDSNDTVLLKSHLDTMQTNYNIKKLDSVNEELIDIDSKEDETRINERKLRTKRLASEINQDSSRSTDEEDNLASADKSFNESKTALNPTNDQFISRLNKSEQSTKTRGRFSKASDESDKEIEDDVSKLNSSSLVNKKDTFLRKSMERRASLNKSFKDSSMQNVSANKSLQIDDLDEELNTDAHIEKKLYKKKRSLNKSRNEDADDNAIESGIKNVSTKDSSEKNKDISLNHYVDQESKSIETKTMIYLSNDDESDDSDINIAPMDFGSKTYSMIANAGSDSNDQDKRDSSYLFAKSNSDNDSDDSSSNSDINREYNLDGVEKSKFSDDDVLADECRTSEVEFSDSDDNGSDLADFIVDDDNVENEEEDDVENEEEDDVGNEEEDDDNDDVNNEKEDNESESEQYIEENDEAEEEVEDEENKQAYINTESINMEDENERDNEDMQEKDYTDREEDAKENKFEMEAISSYASISNKPTHKSKNKSNEYISPRSDTEMKRDFKIKKSSMKKNEKTILLDSSNSDLSIKKKKQKSLENEMKFSSTPNRNSYKKLEFDERISENKDIKSDDTIKATQNILVKKEKSKKDSTLNKDIDLKKFSNVDKEKILNSNFSPDLLKLLEKTNISKSSSFKTELHKTMNIVDTETPTIKHLRKEKLNESVPTLKLNTETSSLPTKKLSTEKKDTLKQIKIKEKSNKDEVSDLIMLSNDNVIQKCNQKKQKKCKKRDTLKKNIDETLSEDAIELNVSKKKKSVKLTQLIIADDNIHEDASQVNEKKKKKKQGISKENIVDKALSEDAIELKIPKKKKLAKREREHTQLTLMNDNILEDVCQISERKKKKKQNISRENIINETMSEDTVELKIPKKKKPVKFTQLTIIDDNIRKDASISEKKKKKKKKQETSKEDIDEALYENVELKIPKKKKCVKFIQSSVVEDNTCEDMCQINEKEKQKKKQKTLRESIAEKALFEDVELKIPKKKKRAQLSQLAIMEDNTCKNVYHTTEKKKKKKKENITEKAFSENDIELKIPKKKKLAKQVTQLTLMNDNIHEDACQISEKKKKKQISIIKDENVNEDNILRKNICENKTELAQQKKKNKITHNLKLNSPTDEPIIKKKKQQETVESIETLRMEKKKNTLPVQIPVLKLKSNKNLLSHKSLRKTALDASDSRNVVCIKKLDEVTTNMCIPKELKPKKKRDQTEDIENMNIPNKRSKKEVKEMIKFLPSSSGVKRLSDNVIENLVDVPRVKKRRKVSRNEEQVVPSVKNKSKVTTPDCDHLFTWNTSDCTTQFHVVNLQNAKKQSSKGAAASFRQRMLAKNKREPISAYMMYHDKMNFK